MTRQEGAAMGAAISLIESGATCEVYLLDGKKYASKFSRSQH